MINLHLEIILFLLTILIFNGWIYSLIFIKMTNTSKKDVSILQLLIASIPIRSSLSETNMSQALTRSSSLSDSAQSMMDNIDDIDEIIEAHTNSSPALTTASSPPSTPTSSAQDLYDRFGTDDIVEIVERLILEAETNTQPLVETVIETETDIQEVIADNVHVFYGWGLPEELTPYDVDHFLYISSPDSITVLNEVTFADWREIVMDLHDLPYNTPAHIIQQVKLEELNILYSQDILYYNISQGTLRHLIELVPAYELFDPEINNFILIMMSYY